MASPRCAIVGAGSTGLMALKNCLEEGLDVVCFESRAQVGGLWKYSTDGGLSVAEGTIFNSSRYRTAIPDFPYSKEVGDYPTWQQMEKYFSDYADAFDLRPHIRFGTRVIHITRKDSQWEFELESVSTQEKTMERFDKVMIATGTFVSPKQPKFEGIEKFTGWTKHAMLFHGSPEVKDKNVMVIGLHASAVDVAQTLKTHGATKVFVAHNRGVVLLPRYNAEGATIDQLLSVGFVRVQILLQKIAPSVYIWMVDRMARKMTAAAFPDIKPSWNFSPAPTLAATTPVIGDEIYPLLQSGYVEPVSGVDCITGARSVQLLDGRMLDDVDAIIYCTGYHVSGSLFDREHDPYAVPGAVGNLWRGLTPLHPDPEVRHSLAWLAHGGVLFPGFAQYELVSQAVIQIWKGNTEMPSYEDMLAWHKGLLEWRRGIVERYNVKSTFYQFMLPFADHFEWLERAAGSGVMDHFSWWRLRSWRLWWQDRDFYRQCVTGVWSPALFRLFDCGKRKAWPGAREQVLEDQRMAREQVRRRREELGLDGKVGKKMQ